MTQDELLFSYRREYFIIRGIFEKLLPDQFQYRPTPKSRSIEELLKYLTRCGYAGLVRILKDDAEIASHKASPPLADLAHFPSALDAEYAKIEKRVRAIDPQAWDGGRSNHFWGDETSLQAAIIETSLKWVIAYRMNLFLWAKEAGNLDLDKNICWAHP